MRTKPFPVPVFHARFLLFAAAGLMILPLPWFFCAVLAALVHELFHLVALKLCSVPICGILVDLWGTKIETGSMSSGKEFLCAAAGPVGSLLLLLFARVMPVLAFCGTVQGMFNLLPVYPLDGGRMMKALLELAIPNQAEKWSKGISCATGMGVFALMLYVCIRFCSVLFLVIGLGVLRMLWLPRKKSCKQTRLRVQ